MAQGRRPRAQTALLIVAPLVLLAYAGVGGWLWWADRQDQAALPPVTEEPAAEATGTVVDDSVEPQPVANVDTGTSAPAPTDENPEPDAQTAAPEPDSDARPEVPAQGDDGQADAVPATKQDEGSQDAAPVVEDEKPADDTTDHATSDPEASTESHGEAEPEKSVPEPLDQTAAEPAFKPEPLPPSSPLKPAPDPDLTIRGRYGPLPQRADDGREVWQVYARPFDRRADARVIALVITELGLSERPTLSAIQDLPGEVTLAFTPYSRRLAEWVPAARAAGHEVLLQVPMEPRNIELNDPGDKALLTTNDPEVNLDRLEWVMSRATGYIGLTSFMGSRMTVSEKDLRPVMDAMAARGLAYVDPKVTPVSIAGKLAKELGMPAASSDRFIDLQAAREPIDRRLGQLEQIALSRGSAIGFAQAYPVTIERLRKWIPEMQKRGFELAPVSAVVNR